MNTDFRLFPESASTIAGRVDAVYLFLVALTAFFTLLIAGLIVFFAVRYRRGARVDRTRGHVSLWVEISWMVAPLPVLLFIFFWSTNVYFAMQRPPAGAMEVGVVGKQWMWKIQQPGGRREINELHVPTGKAVRLTMISQDVIHSFYIPAFRVKQDVLPGRYTSLWFEATVPGEYHLFCAEYCGTDHSRMIGRVVVMSPSDYESWLSGTAADEPPAVAGQKLFEQMRCDGCHRGAEGIPSRGPPLEGLYVRAVPLATGDTVIADDNYLRESILLPTAKVVAGFQPIMPTFQGQISEEGVMQIVAYIKSLDEGGAARDDGP